MCLDDPKRMMRVQARVYDIFDGVPAADLPWATYRLPLGVRPSDGGLIPVKVGDLVWVDFPFNGDTRRPRITGGVHYAPDGNPKPILGDNSKTRFVFDSATDRGKLMPIKPGSVKVLHDRNVVAADDGNGHILGVFSLSGTTINVSETFTLSMRITLQPYEIQKEFFRKSSKR